jgi:hypothetical protein
MKNKINLPGFNVEITLDQSALVHSTSFQKESLSQDGKITPAGRLYCRAWETYYDYETGRHGMRCVLLDRTVPNAQSIQDAL